MIKELEVSDSPTGKARPRSGRPSIMDDAKDEQLRAFALQHHYDFTWLEAAEAIGGISAASLWRWAQKTGWREVCRRFIPRLTDIHKATRLQWATDNFRNSWDGWIDLDEKWFYACRAKKVKVPAGCLTPTMPVQSKRFVPKIMFVAAIARPDATNDFDGLIGIWRVSEVQLALRTSKNRPAGAEVEKDVTMTADWYQNFLETKLVPQIRRRMPWRRDVTVQIDGASPHVGKGSVEFSSKFSRADARTKVSFVVQPAQSPDCNTLDLGMWNSLQTARDKLARKQKLMDLSELADQVEKAFKNISPDTLEDIFCYKSRILREIIKSKGGNDFSMPRK